MPRVYLVGAGCCILWGFMAVWLLCFPASLSSDDALYFSRAMTRYSILDFAPHFPGYPVFVGLGRLIYSATDNPITALQLTTTYMALAIPLASALLVWILTESLFRAAFGFILTLTMPVFACLALSGLSDGTGMVFFLLYLATIPRSKHNKPTVIKGLTAGLLLGLALWSRPSYGVILAVGFLATISNSRFFVLTAIGSLAVSLPSFFFVLSHEGWGYFVEAQRFLTGHTMHWGNTAFATSSERIGWEQSIAKYPAIGMIILMMTVAAVAAFQRRAEPIVSATLASFLCSLLWTSFMQNPENYRHLAPVFILGYVLLCCLPKRRTYVVGTVVVIALNFQVVSTTHLLNPEPSVLRQVADYLNSDSHEGLLLTNRNTSYMRANLKMVRVKGVSASIPVKDVGHTYLLSGEESNASKPLIPCLSRFLGEQELCLYRVGDV